MPLDDDGNYALPFADDEFPTDVPPVIPDFQKSKGHKTRKNKSKNKQPFNEAIRNQNISLRDNLSYIYFENSQEDTNFLSLIPYTGPSNTLHLDKHLYIPQLISTTIKDSTVSVQRFMNDYDQTIISIIPTLETMSLSVYLRFGISYITRADTTLGQTLSVRDFVTLRNRGKQIKTAFYTCKGVTSPKHLVTTINKLNYRQISSNTYSYDIQIHGIKSSQYPILHFEYDEQFRCRSVFHRPYYPVNYDFIRNKSSSQFRSLDDSYSDIFDFRIQLVQVKHLSKTDSNVLDTLRDVPFDEVLFLDKSTHILHVSPKLRQFVKYLKCTRSSSYENSDEQILLSIGSYEEFNLNARGSCELSMKAENTMTIKLLDLKTIPSGEKLYDIGIWFSTLCQTCVDLPKATMMETNANKPCKWFSAVFGRAEKYNEMNVNQLTTYKKQTSKQTYTNEELASVKKFYKKKIIDEIF